MRERSGRPNTPREPTGTSGMTEKDLETRLVEKLRSATPCVLQDLSITRSTSDARSLYALLGETPFDLFQDTSDWNPSPTFMIDVAGGITPDIVIRSRSSGRNRIYIEVKLHEEIRGDRALSQVTRQFLHLLATTQRSPDAQSDIRRAVLLAAPSAWFEQNRHRAKWDWFRCRYEDLARLSAIDITLGELKLDSLLGEL